MSNAFLVRETANAAQGRKQSLAESSDAFGLPDGPHGVDTVLVRRVLPFVQAGREHARLRVAAAALALQPDLDHVGGAAAQGGEGAGAAAGGQLLPQAVVAADGSLDRAV